MIKAVKFVSIPVKDQNQALDFYTKKLGFTIMTDQPFDGKQRWIELGINGRRYQGSSLHAGRPAGSQLERFRTWCS